MHVPRILLAHRAEHFGDLFFDFRERAFPARPIETDLAAAVADLLGTHECRSGWDAGEHALLTLICFLRGLDLIPLREHFGCGVDARRAREHVRMTADQLVGDA